MMTQLRKDIFRTFQSVRDLIVSHPPGEEGLADALMRWLDGATRFVEPHPTIVGARRTIYEGADKLIAVEQRTSAGPNKVGRTHLLAALADLEATIYAHGRASSDADRVGIALAGSPL